MQSRREWLHTALVAPLAALPFSIPWLARLRERTPRFVAPLQVSPPAPRCKCEAFPLTDGMESVRVDLRYSDEVGEAFRRIEFHSRERCEPCELYLAWRLVGHDGSFK